MLAVFVRYMICQAVDSRYYTMVVQDTP